MNNIPIFNAGHIIIPAKCVNCKHLHFGVFYTDSFDKTDIHMVRKLCDLDRCEYISKGLGIDVFSDDIPEEIARIKKLLDQVREKEKGIKEDDK